MKSAIVDITTRILSPALFECAGMYGYGSGFFIPITDACEFCPNGEECYELTMKSKGLFDMMEQRQGGLVEDVWLLERQSKVLEDNILLGRQYRSMISGQTTSNGFIKVVLR